MNTRIKEVRESLLDENGKKYTQTKFAECLHVTRDIIASYEYGKVIPTPLFIDSLCKTFNISETWLRTGEGEMKAPLTVEEEIASMTAELYKGDKTSIKYKLMRMVSKMSEEDLEKFVEAAKHIAEFVEEDENGLD